MKLLLQVCCAPCMLGCLDRLVDDFQVTAYYYNPNTYDELEYNKRLLEVKNVLGEHYKSVDLIVAEYNYNEFLDVAKGLEDQPERGLRCEKCVELRLEATAKLASDLNFDFFDSTLSVSPHKNFKHIKNIGENLSKMYHVGYFGGDFKKNDGYLKSTKKSCELNVYRQNFCGCEFSKRV